jgi:hypothetical protein
MNKDVFNFLFFVVVIVLALVGMLMVVRINHDGFL